MYSDKTSFFPPTHQILTIPVKAVIAVGTLNSSPKHIVFPPSFPVSHVSQGSTSLERTKRNILKGHVCFVDLLCQGKVVHQSYSIQSSFTQKVRLQQIRSLTEDIRFYYKRLRSNKDELEPRRKSKVATPPSLPVTASPERVMLRHPLSRTRLLPTDFFFLSSIFFRWQIFILTPACSVVITVMWGCHLCLNVRGFSFIDFLFSSPYYFGSQ